MSAKLCRLVDGVSSASSNVVGLPFSQNQITQISELEGELLQQGAAAYSSSRKVCKSLLTFWSLGLLIAWNEVVL